MYTLSKIKIAVSKYIFRFVQKPTPVCYIGPGKIKKVEEVLEMNNVQRVLVITSKSLTKLGPFNTMIEGIEKKGIKVFIYDSVKPDPTFTITDEVLKVCTDNKCQAVVAVGGGSVIDTAKTVNVAFTNNKLPKKLEGLLKVKKIGLPFIAVPTTAGTGSETTLAAVISDPDTHKKTTIVDPKIVPVVAVLDPELTLGLPVSITAHTAMDALTHALEAYVGTYATEETNRYAEVAIKLIYDNLLKVYTTPQDVEAREAMLVASFYAGMAFTRAYVGYVHAFAHNIGGKFGVPHGLANSVLLPHIMESYSETCQQQYAALADLVGISKPSDSMEVKSRKFIESIFELNQKLDIPEYLEKFDKTAIVEIRNAGFKECHGTYPVPRYLTAEEADKILKKIAAL